MASTNTDSKEIEEAFNKFPFATDQEYQAGLQGIFSSDAFSKKSDAEKENTLRLSRVFYFNKITGNSITLEEAFGFESASRPLYDNCETEQHQQAAGGEVRTLTFTELKALIEEGKTDGIPNNKVIPNILNAAPPSENSGKIRNKPWET